jgi:hypothetical protein
MYLGWRAFIGFVDRNAIFVEEFVLAHRMAANLSQKLSQSTRPLGESECGAMDET